MILKRNLLSGLVFLLCCTVSLSLFANAFMNKFKKLEGIETLALHLKDILSINVYSNPLGHEEVENISNTDVSNTSMYYALYIVEDVQPEVDLLVYVEEGAAGGVNSRFYASIISGGDCRGVVELASAIGDCSFLLMKRPVFKEDCVYVTKSEEKYDCETENLEKETVISREIYKITKDGFVLLEE